MRERVCGCAIAAVMLAGCSGDLERMREQPRADRYEATPVFPDGKVLQHPPAGTVEREPIEMPIVAGAAGVPIALDLDVLRVGEERFNVYCAACHGVLGDGDSPVADQMPLRKPPSLLEPRIVAQTPAEIYEVVTNGYGLMPPYSFQLNAPERWAVVGYVRALQRSQGVRLEDLPAPIQQAARTALAEPAP